MIAIIDFGISNIGAVYNALSYLNIKSKIISKATELKFSKKFIIPGSGKFGKGMHLLKEKGFVDKLNELVLVKKYPILGICLGHQAIAENFGAKLYNMKEPLHGVQTDIYLGNDYIFDGIQSEIKACRYHSWSVESKFFPEELKIIAEDCEGVVMALSHKKYDLKGIEFHPESIQTETGFNMIKNFINN